MRSFKQPQITDRDLDIFTDLYVHNLLNTDHLASIYCHSEGHKQRLRRRLQLLKASDYVRRLDTPINCPRDYVLTQRGMNALSNKRGIAPKRINPPSSTRSYRHHDLSLSDFTLTIDLFVRSHPSARLIDELSLINRSQCLQVRSHRGWEVSFRFEGTPMNHWVKPDRFWGIEFTDRPATANARYYAIELDRGTMPLRASSPYKASIQRKLLAYQATCTDRILHDTFAIPHAYTLFVTSGKRRRDNMVELAKEIVTNKKAAEAMLFAVQPPTPTVSDAPDLSEISWINGLGEKTALPL